MTILDDPNLYTIGWIAALPIERASATALLDERHGPPRDFEQHQSDSNSYTWGRIGEHNIVIASLPAGMYGITSAATTASNLLSSLPQIRIGLLVGIGGAVARPDRDRDIRLGDVAVSQPDGTEGGVVQYDLGKATSNESWQRKGSLNMPPPVLLSALANLQAEHEISQSKVPDLLNALWTANPQMSKSKNKAPAYVHQGFENDRLFLSTYDHAGGGTCNICDASKEVQRDQRDTTEPDIHYGVIASGNKLIKDAATRDKIADVLGKECICFEMEAAGLMNHFPCLVIRGICDYTDSHKNDRWQRYASATAAAYAKELLGFVPAKQLHATQRAIDTLRSISDDVKSIQYATAHMERGVRDIHAVVLNVDQKAVLSRLEDEVAPGASFDSHAEEHSPRCLPNTRVELLEHMSAWANDASAEAIFWLNGMAGTGKSTVSRTLAQSFASKNHLIASFFFKRGERDRESMSKLFSTIAADLARREPAAARHIKDAIDNDPAILRGTIREQFNKLICGPISMIPLDLRRAEPIIIIIDALDECEGEEDVKLMIHLFSRAGTAQSLRLKVFLTSRPELPIRLGFKAIEGTYQDLILHDIPLPVIEHDISTFLEHELARIRCEYNVLVPEDRQLSENWPSLCDIKTLVKMAIPLFIFAATICRFIADRRIGTPDKLLSRALLPQTHGQVSQLGKTYLPVLDNLITGSSDYQREEILQEFRNIVGSIVILASPLSTSALARILDIPRGDVEGRLDLLHSVLSIPSSADVPVRLLHLSFRDFLMDPKQRACNEFWIDEKQSHRAMAMRCLRVMEILREDVCDIKAPGTFRSTIDQRKVDACIPSEVQYACLYWVYHMQRSGGYGNREQVHSFLKLHFLHWLESLSLIGRAREAVYIIKELQSLHKSRSDKHLSEFLEDSMRFILANMSGIDSTPLQLYSSFLAFTPEKSQVRITFKGHIWRRMSVLPKVEGNWGKCMQTLEGHRGWVSSVAFSHDSKLVASTSDDETIRIWHADTGECTQTLEGHGGWVNSVAFSHDSKLVASASDDRTVRIWHADTGECTQTLEGHGGSVRSVAFSHDSKLVASASDDRTVRIWHADTGECTQTLEGHGGSVRSVAFSHDSKLVASASDDRTVRIWHADTGECTRTLEGHRGSVSSVAFSHDSKLVASTSYDRTVRIWRADTGECTQTLEGHGGEVSSVAFSHDSKLVASTSNDRTVRIWRADTGECTQTLEGHGGWVRSVAFSHDSKLVASASDDRTVRIWHADTGECTRTLEGHRGEVSSVAFSHDSKLVASASNDRTVRIWRADTGECTQTLEGHGGWVNSVAFSHDSKLVASASYDKTIRIWHADTGECTRTLEGHGGSVRSVAFSHDSRLVASASYDKTIRIWHAETGECTQTINVGVTTTILSFEREGTRILTTSGPFTILGNAPSISSSVNPPRHPPVSVLTHSTICGISQDKRWVTLNGERVFWLPVEFRPSCWAVSESTLSMGCSSGRVIIIGFTQSGRPEVFSPLKPEHPTLFLS